ncbi:matrix remodeling-associated protein 8 [Lates calcarifer]|uniref:Matrix remodeling-associated protein 8 n=1 Tax=Lates calcarifer TaxID=8187 RepID=A0AAJ7PSV0_LATCA|nr:matrix remodeling-associated protein 8 [Lates calcarifer]
MAAVTSALLWWTSLSACLLISASEFQLIRTVPGQTVTLPCRAPRNTNIKAVEWTRTDLETDYILLYWDERPDPEKQHPSFQNRVELRDSQMKDGDLSLFLKDVTRDDSGIYKCRVQRKTNYWERSYLDTAAISVIYLKVEIIHNITAVSGDNVTLPCRALSNIPILVAEWTRPDLEPQHVLYQQLSWSIAQYQHPFFKNRVKLEESKMENGDASLILKNVTSNDTGRYECRVDQRETNRRKRAYLRTEPINIINLTVRPPGHTDDDMEDGGNKDGGIKEEERGQTELVGLIVGLSVVGLIVVVIVVYMTFRRHRGFTEQN